MTDDLMEDIDDVNNKRRTDYEKLQYEKCDRGC